MYWKAEIRSTHINTHIGINTNIDINIIRIDMDIDMNMYGTLRYGMVRYASVQWVQIVRYVQYDSMYRSYGRVRTDRTVCTNVGKYVSRYLVPIILSSKYTKYTQHIDNYCQLLARTTFCTKRHVVFFSAPSLKCRNQGLGIPIHIEMQFTLIRMD